VPSYAVIEGIIDKDSLFELKPRFARNLVTALARIDGQPVGIIANNPRIKAGTVDASASTVGARFISFCDAFSIPIVWLMDCPGVLPGPDSEEEGIARRSGKLIYEIARSTVPSISVVLRRGYGFGYVVMGGGRAGESEFSVA
jgi:acetyl-CoA carboxylase carboxyltransferase component